MRRLQNTGPSLPHSQGSLCLFYPSLSPPRSFPLSLTKPSNGKRRGNFSNAFIKQQVTSFLLTKAIYGISLTSPSFTTCRAPSVRAAGDQSAFARCGCHWTRGPYKNTLLKWLRFMLPEFTCIMLLDKVQLARCFLAMLQTALGFRLKSETAALAGRTTGVKPSLPTSETISPWAQIQTHRGRPISQAVAVHKATRVKQLVMWIAQGKKKTQHKTQRKLPFLFWCDLQYLVSELYYRYMSSCAWFNNSSSQVADSDLRYYSRFSLSQLRSEIRLSLCMTRTDTDRRNLAAVCKDKAWKNRIQEETRVAALTHRILSIIQGC